MDLINGKTMWCPTCGKPFNKYDGKVNGKTAHVMTYCKDCNKHYHWVAYIHKNTKEHTVCMFSEYLELN